MPASTTTFLWITSITSTSLLAIVSLLWRRERSQFASRAAVLISEAAAERKARIRHEIQARESKRVTHEEENPPIGYIRTMFAGRYGTPRQGSLAKSTLGVIEIDSSVLDGCALEGLEQFSFVWLLFIFHENTNEHKVGTRAKQTFKAKIKPPGMLGEKTGVLSTRSPHRPSKLGLSLVKIVNVEPQQKRLTVSAVDLLDGTPIVDIKPFVPMDIPWETPVRYPEWVARSMHDGETKETARLDVQFSEQAIRNLEHVLTVSDVSKHFFTGVNNAVDVLSEALRLDFRAVHQGRYGAAASDHYETLKMKMCDFEMQFTIRGGSSDGEKIVLTVNRVTKLENPSPASSPNPEKTDN
jgi:tRNA-Thr(GGU) m(6)t(6)A37 methyltransferase TsaA